MDISRSLETQGPVDVIVHKMTDVVGKMKQGDAEAQVECERFMVSSPFPANHTWS